MAESAKTPKPAPTEEPKDRKRPAVRYPAYSLIESVAVAKAIHEQGGGVASRDRLAAFLQYSTTNSGAFFGRIAAARLFGLITSRGSDFVITPLAQKILLPVFPEQTREGLVEAFLNVPLFKDMYEEHDKGGKPLPPEMGMKNLFRSKFGMDARQAADAYRGLMESADAAGFFTTRNARSHLIIPQLTQQRPPAPPATADEQPPAANGSGSGGDGSGGGRPGTGLADVKAAYVTTLIDLFKKKSESGEMDDALMDRIEKLLSS